MNLYMCIFYVPYVYRTSNRSDGKTKPNLCRCLRSYDNNSSTTATIICLNGIPNTSKLKKINKIFELP